MYLWNTKALAKELRDGTLTERERMKYFLLSMAVMAAASDVPFSRPEPISLARIIIYSFGVIATVVGIYGAYRINRAGDDKDFIARAMCLSIPILTRIIVLFVGVYVVCKLSISMVGEATPELSEPQTDWFDVVLVLIIEVMFYWRLWHHIAWVSRPQPPPDTIAGVSPRKIGCWLAGIGVALFLCAVLVIGVSAGLLYGRGVNKSRDGDLDGAITHFTQVIQLCPQLARAYYERGVAFSRKGDYDKAIADFDKAIEFDPKLARAYFARGVAYSWEDQYDRAIVDLDKTIELDPTYARAYCERGVAFSRKGDHDKAIADFGKAIELDPTYARAYRERGAAYRSKGQYDPALADLGKAIELDPKYASAYYNRGLTYCWKGDYAKAIADCTRAIELDPEDGRGSYYRACAYSMQHRWSDAQADFRWCCEWVDSKMRDYARLKLWVVGSQLGQKEAANKELAAYFGQPGNAADPWPARIAEFLLGKTRESDLMAAAASPYPYREQGRRTEGWYYAGMKRLLSGDKAAAADCFRKCVAMGRQSFTEYECAQAELKALGL